LFQKDTEINLCRFLLRLGRMPVEYQNYGRQNITPQQI